MALFAVSAILPAEVPGLPITLASMFGVHAYAKQVQGESIDAHVAAGGGLRSKWAAVGTALVCLVAVVVLVVGVLFGLDAAGVSIEGL